MQIGQHDVLRGEPGDFAAVLPHRVPALRPDEDPERIVGIGTVLEHHRRRQCVVPGRRQDSAVDEADVPLSEIARRHREFARREQPPGRHDGRRAERPEGMTVVADRIGLTQTPHVHVRDAVHAEWREHPRLQELDQRHPRDLLDDPPRDHVVGVAVLPLGPRIEIQRLLRPRVEDLLSRRRHHHVRHYVVLRPVILVAGRMRQDLADRHLVPASQPRDVARDGITEGEFPLLRQQHDRGRRELLAHRPDGISHVGLGSHGR